MDDQTSKVNSTASFVPVSPQEPDTCAVQLHRLQAMLQFQPQSAQWDHHTVCHFTFNLLSLGAKVEHILLVQFNSPNTPASGGQILSQTGTLQQAEKASISRIILSRATCQQALSELNQGHEQPPWCSISIDRNNVLQQPALFLIIKAAFISPELAQTELLILHSRLKALLNNGQYEQISPDVYQALTMQASENPSIDRLCEQLRLALKPYLADVENYVIMIKDNEPSLYYTSSKKLTAPLYLSLAKKVINERKAQLFTPLSFAHWQCQQGSTPHSMPLQHAWYGTPIFYGEKLLGVLAICSASKQQTMQAELRALTSYCAYLAALTLQRQLTQYSIQESLQFDRQVKNRIKQLSQSNRKLEQELKQYQSVREKLTYGAFHDPLTQLGNRALFIEKLRDAFKRVQRHPEQTFAVIFIDLNKFKNINDYFGHQMGDQVLIHSARLLETCIRQNDVLSRFGGDEFVIMLDKISHKSDIIEIAQRIVAAFDSPMSINNELLTCKCSLGITQVSNHYENVEQILEDADQAMYEAKHSDSHFSFYQDNGISKNNDQLSQDLLEAISHGDIVPHYQPMIRLQDNSLMGFEVVARWSDRKHTLRKALDFIPFAEKSGLIIDLDLDILRQACQQLHQWQKLALHPKHIRVAVNLSAKHLIKTESVEQLLAIIREAKVSPKNLVFEFSEKEFVRQNQPSFEALDMLRKEGILIGMDDFGTGFSSLNALFDYPIDFIKVDRSFTQRMLSSKKDLSMMRAVRDMSNDLGFQVIIEGIETLQQHKKLVEIGCEYGQGYYIAKPMKPGDVEHLFEA
ncbi:putative bifunctional diguanylate cyclase/phosphodiesterase [Motilimonas eburnea]|uniref:putative bifunctional diguanylate cyclase/phosphodiesterase n=1 Tax=Motilimonas eburnea TaxID=1737488 RepID=UPI001E458F16|nr:GGDEF domain-containing phosphodiesterase [Motilimonas eburnea]MCE2572677.1 EAL domain-containing protein [Motilimonas eburnea]